MFSNWTFENRKFKSSSKVPYAVYLLKNSNFQIFWIGEVFHTVYKRQPVSQDIIIRENVWKKIET